MKTFTTLMLCSVLTIFTLQAEPQILDSMTVRTFSADTQLWMDTDKEEYAFDGKGNLTLFINHDWNEDTQELLPSTKEVYTYDDQDRRTSYVTHAWNDSTSAWIPNFKEEHTYDGWDETLYLLSNWNDTIQQWIYEKKTERAHDTNGNRTLFARYNWGVNTEQWLGINNKCENAYDENNNIILSIKYEWDISTGQWIISHEGEYLYDNENREILNIYYRWDESSQQWINHSKEENTYTDNSQTYREYEWDNESNYWKPTDRWGKIYDDEGRLVIWNGYTCLSSDCYLDTRTIWEYDSDGNLLRLASQEGNPPNWSTALEFLYTYDSNGNILTSTDNQYYWDDYSLSEYEYDTNNNRTEYRRYEKEYEFGDWTPEHKGQRVYNTDNQNTSTIHSDWNTSTQEWEYAWKSTRTYDDAYTYEDLILPPSYEYSEGYFQGKRTNDTLYNWENGEWVYDYERTYHYSTAQCPLGDVQLKNQAEVDAFVAQYPNCTQISGSLNIGSGGLYAEINDLSAMPPLERITGNLTFTQIHNVFGSPTSVYDDFSQLKTIGGSLIFSGNDALTSINDFHQLDSIGGDLAVSGHYPDLHTFSGFEQLKYIGGDFNYFGNSPSSIPAFDSLTFVQNISISDGGQGLGGVNGFKQLTHIPGNVSISLIVSLSIGGFNALHEIGGNLSLSGDGTVPTPSNISAFNQLTKVGENFSLSSTRGSLNTFSQLDTIQGNLSIRSNKGASFDLSSFDHPIFIGGNLTISENDVSDCAVQAICDHLYIGGNATIELNESGCQNIEEVTAVCNIPTPNTHPDMVSSIIISPNPVSNTLNVNVLNGKQIDNISIFDTVGKQIINQSIVSNTLNVSTLPQGMYWLKIEIGKDILYKKIVVR